MTQGFCGFLLLLGGEGAICMTGAGPFLSANQNKIKTFIADILCSDK